MSYGLTVVVWDKIGCGNSDGEFDINQPVENSAEEEIAAIEEIKNLKIPGSEKIGFWGACRAGWIVSLINQRFPMDFWISVSGTDDKENFGYLLKSNLTIVGKPKEELDRLYEAWMLGHKIESLKGSYEKLISATEPLRQDSTCRELFGYTILTKDNYEEGRKEYLQNQKLNSRKGHFDEEIGLWTIIDDFDKILLNIDCSVLALFGQNDLQVDWRKTKRLYEKTIGTNKKSELTVEVFKNCNHNLQKCVTCAWKEDVSVIGRQPCIGYDETMEEWFRKYKLIKELLRTLSI